MRAAIAVMMIAGLYGAGCTNSGGFPRRIAAASATEEKIRWVIAANVAASPHLGSMSIIGTARLTDAAISAPMRRPSFFGNGQGETYCVSATMTVAGIPQPKSVYATVIRDASTVDVAVSQGWCTGTYPFPELEIVSSRR
jgi:hypothetical protein